MHTIRFFRFFKTAITALWTNKSRSFLTILGIVIGITSIVLVVAIGSGAESIIVNELGALGAETVVIRPGKEPSGPSDVVEILFNDSLKERELKALLNTNNVIDVIDGSPEILVSGSVSYRGETFRPLTLGFDAEMMVSMLDLRMERGIVFDERDIKSRAKVAIIGSKVVSELFGDADPLGELIEIKGHKFRVIGTFAKRGQVVFFNVDELVIVPYSTAQTYLAGFNYYNQIILRAKSPESVARVVHDAEQTLRELHKIETGEVDDFNIQTQQGIVDQVKSIVGIFTLFLSFVVAISLVVGGIGVMNIMLVSVTERTREIGLRKAIGATNRDILIQFLIEAIVLTGIGGIFGVLIGSLFAYIASMLVSGYTAFDLVFVFPTSAALMGIAVSSTVGLIFGIFPARKASKMNPIEALRYE